MAIVALDMRGWERLRTQLSSLTTLHVRQLVQRKGRRLVPDLLSPGWSSI